MMAATSLLTIFVVSQLLSSASAAGYCTASGDPHYVTFDGYRYDFQGACRYIHTTDACPGGAPGTKTKLATFKVIADNQGRRVTMVRNVEVHIHGRVIQLTSTSWPAPQTTPGHTLTREGNQVVIRSIPPAITVKWNLRTNLQIILEEQYRERVCGLCGNFDRNAGNDRMTSFGTLAPNIVSWANSWNAGGQCGVPNPPQHPCEKHPERRTEAQKDCEVIKSNSFASCRGLMDTEPLFHNCLYDVCAVMPGAAVESSCNAISEASTECAEKNPGIRVDWGHLREKCRCKKMAQMEQLNVCCQFPFKYQGRYHYKCIDPRNAVGFLVPFNKPWCATVEDLDAQPKPLNFVGMCL